MRVPSVEPEMSEIQNGKAQCLQHFVKTLAQRSLTVRAPLREVMPDLAGS